MRRDKINYYLDIAEVVSKRCTCLRRHYGAIIVKADEVIATGYVGAPRGRKNCTDMQICLREERNIASGERYELCRSIHAEANAMLSASRKDMIDSTMYMTCINPKTGEYIQDSNSCPMCKRLAINAGIKELVVRDTKDDYRVIQVQDWVDNDDSLEDVFGYVKDIESGN